jgi:hypothetical protein
VIRRRTVLVLGAGASMPYGFPSGRQLKTIIVADALSPTNGGVTELVNQAGYDTNKFREFASALQHSGRGSVDEFLEFRAEFLEVGKAAIAAALIPLENEARLFPAEARADDLYQHLFSQMNTDRDAWSDNAISIVTFNYDRSVEHYMVIAFANAYGVTQATAGKVVAKVPIIHVYGSLGFLPSIQDGGREYIANASADNLRLAASGILILHENHPSSAPALQKAKELMAVAESIYFLGFGYHRTNLQRLDVRSIRHHIDIHGTTSGFSDAEIEDIRARFSSAVRLDKHKRDSVAFLRELPPLASAP